MHTINLTQRFLANQPWKNSHGENQSERGEIFIILQQSTGQKNSGKIQLISIGKIYLKVWKMCSANQPNTHLLFCAKITCKCPAVTGRTSPRKPCQKMQPYSSNTGRTSSSNFVPKNCRLYTDISAEI